MDTNKSKEQNSYSVWKNLLNEFFWTCSGANKEILRQCPTEYSKYFGIGGTIFFTAAMATLSGGYAFYTIFNNQWLAIAFGIFWGLLIFNLDRFIVNTMYSDGKHTISWGELAAGLPRIIIALFLGIVISTPLELKIFEDEINVEIDFMKEDKLANYTRKDSVYLESLVNKKELYLSKIDTIRGAGQSLMYQSSIDNVTNQQNKTESVIKNLQSQLDAKNTSLSILRGRLANTTDSITRVNINRQIGQVKKEISNINSNIAAQQNKANSLNNDYNDILNSDIEQKQQQISEYQNEISIIDSEITVVKERLNNSKDEYKEKLNKEFNGFQAHMLAFDKIKSENTSTHIVSIFIMLMFIIIEIAPTFFKMMIASGPYDELLNEEMHRKKVQAMQNVSNLNDEVNTQIQISTEKNRQRLEAELKANENVLTKIAAVQAELLEVAIEEWRKEELEKIKANPSQYIQSNTTKA